MMKGRRCQKVWVNGEKCPSVTQALMWIGARSDDAKKAARSAIRHGGVFRNSKGESYSVTMIRPVAYKPHNEAKDMRLKHEHVLGHTLLRAPCTTRLGYSEG